MHTNKNRFQMKKTTIFLILTLLLYLFCTYHGRRRVTDKECNQCNNHLYAFQSSVETLESSHAG